MPCGVETTHCALPAVVTRDTVTDSHCGCFPAPHVSILSAVTRPHVDCSHHRHTNIETAFPRAQVSIIQCCRRSRAKQLHPPPSRDTNIETVFPAIVVAVLLQDTPSGGSNKIVAQCVAAGSTGYTLSALVSADSGLPSSPARRNFSPAPPHRE